MFGAVRILRFLTALCGPGQANVGGERAVHVHRIREADHAEMLPVANGAEEVVDLGIGNPPRSELAGLLVAARREFLAAEGHFLDRDELARELAERRAEASALNGDGLIGAGAASAHPPGHRVQGRDTACRVRARGKR
jgi:hypothetical protein